MLKFLSDEQLSNWKRDGAVWPIDLLTTAEVNDLARRLEILEASIGVEAQSKFRIKAHLPFPWLWDLIRNPRLADIIEDLLGPNIVCWGSSFFTKKPHDPRFVSWHQDSTYYGLEPPESITAWVAFTPANALSGCMRIIPGSYKGDAILPHEETFGKNNLLSRGQTILGIDESAAVEMPLKPGQISVHHNKTIHSSRPNKADWPRVGFAIHFTTTDVHQTQFANPLAIHIRGDDPEGNWIEDPYPEYELSPASVKACEDYCKRYRSAIAARI
ncbi:MAG: phytanoyl-CoA dioxygenase family protein [Pseudomonadota bacterium]|nr:phytanoyl-CoA dioxygenase family protein [Pseudomonadota bacterium]